MASVSALRLATEWAAAKAAVKAAAKEVATALGLAE